MRDKNLVKKRRCRRCHVQPQVTFSKRHERHTLYMKIKHSQNHVHAPTTEKSSAQASASLAQGFSADLVQKCVGFNIDNFHKTIFSPLAGTNPIFTFFSRASSTDYLWT
jgi:hypothetical protein